jgi:hypothetical protein
MNTWVLWLCCTIVLALCERLHLALETMALRHQLAVLARSATRPQCSPVDRCVWVLWSTVWSRWQEALTIVQPDTVRRWRRQGWRHHLGWWRGRKRPGRPAIAAEIRALIGNSMTCRCKNSRKSHFATELSPLHYRHAWRCRLGRRNIPGVSPGARTCPRSATSPEADATVYIASPGPL